MKILQRLLLVLAGVLSGVAGQKYFAARPVHAEGQIINGVACTTSVPKSWGEFKGASEFGVAFEDGEGTIRFVLHPPCGNRALSDAIPTPAADLMMERR